MKTYLLILLLFTLSYAQNTQAELELVEADAKETLAKQTVKAPSNLPLKEDKKPAKERDTWYFLASYGKANTSYPDSITSHLQSRFPAQYRSTGFAFDLGIYFPLAENSMLGLVVNNHLEAFFAKDYGGIGYRSNNRALSYIYFNDKREDGLFVRTDAGVSQSFSADSNGTKYESSLGVGLGAGVGWAHNFDSFSLMATFMFTSYTLNSERVNSTQILFSLIL